MTGMEDPVTSRTSKIVAVEHLTLDGVYQAPARADEDTRSGFAHGGWSKAGDDPKMQQVIGSRMAGGWSLLVGRTTYEDLYEGWQIRQPSNPMTNALRNVGKFVATRQAACTLPWENSTRLSGEGAETVAKLKREHDKTLIVFGSGALLRSLLRSALVDELVLMIHPLVLGTGLRLFEEAPLVKMTLLDQMTTETGVIVATYRAG